MLPFSAHYDLSADFSATVHSLLANPDVSKRIDVEVQDGRLKIKKHGGEYTEHILINTFENDVDKQNYSTNGYNVIVDSRPANTLAEVEAYCVSNDGKNTEISYQDYLTLSDVARLNFDFQLRYTGNELVFDDEVVEGYRAYVDGLSDENRAATQKYARDLAENAITKSEYNRAIYELYFTNYYPEITAYESTSKVPLLRNYYYHQYIKEGIDHYLFIFDDYMAGSFETDSGISRSFYGFYGNVENGILVQEEVESDKANKAADVFIKKSFGSVAPLTLYSHAMNVFSLIPIIALMPMVVTLLAYSILKLCGIESVSSLGATFKIVGSYVWFSAVISAVLAVLTSFFVQGNILTVLPLLLFFVTLAVRSIVFAVNETGEYTKHLQQQTVQTEA
ncbi:MAG: hypothetical protein IJV73_01785 [Clostridia bacterium]|nr:hypothetical protein [Clostridia bacterium]